MGLIEAILLGLLQGLTEFLPISSTAHIRVVPALLGWDDPGPAFTAAIQLGTLLAVLIYFRQELARAFKGWSKSLLKQEHDPLDSRMGWAVLLGTIPIVVIGLLFQKSIEHDLRSLTVVAVSLIVMALGLAVTEAIGKRRRTEEDVRTLDGLWVGLWQCLALIPGMSRSGSSIAGALFCGFDRPAAARFSFLLSVPSVFGAGIYSVLKHRHELLGDLLVPMIVANVFSFVSGYLAIAGLLRMLQRHGTFVFVIYRILLGLLILGLIWQGVLSPMAGISPQP